MVPFISCPPGVGSCVPRLPKGSRSPTVRGRLPATSEMPRWRRGAVTHAARGMLPPRSARDVLAALNAPCVRLCPPGFGGCVHRTQCARIASLPRHSQTTLRSPAPRARERRWSGRVFPRAAKCQAGAGVSSHTLRVGNQVHSTHLAKVGSATCRAERRRSRSEKCVMCTGNSAVLLSQGSRMTVCLRGPGA